MLIMIKVLVGVYALSVNVYSFFLLKFQRDSFEEGECENAVHDGKLFIVALLGGAIGIYAGIFALRYRLHSMFLMVLMPVIIVLNVYLFFLGFTGDFGLYRDYTVVQSSISALFRTLSAYS